MSLKGSKELDKIRMAAYLQMYWTSSSKEIAQSHKSTVNATTVVISRLARIMNLKLER